MKRLPWWAWVIGALLLLTAIVGGIAIGRLTTPGDEGEEPTSTTEPTSTDEPTPTVPADDGSGGTSTDTTKPQYVRVYFVRGEYVGPVTRQIPPTKAVATAAVRELLLGPSATEQGWGLSTQIPVGTELIRVSIADGTARVDLSSEFDDGGGSLSMGLRLGQIVYTLTQFATVQRVEFYMEGERVDVFSGEGIILTSPQTRADYEDVTPPILVEQPTPGATVASPVRLWGTANTFEAMFMVKIEDAAGRVLVDVPAKATSGTGTRGTFDVSIPFALTNPEAGTITAYEASAADGSPINEVAIPVVLSQ